MPELIENRSVECNYCGYGPNIGRESISKDRRGIIHECRWVCGKCNMVIRHDERIEKPEAPKE